MSDQEEYKETWFIVPHHIVDLEGMTIGRLRVFQTIFQFWNKGRKCYLSNPEISRRTGLKITQVKEAISYFEKHNELERIQIGLKRYLMQPLKVVGTDGLSLVQSEVAGQPATCTNITQVAGKPAGGGRQTGLQVAGEPATEINKLNKEIKKDINPIIPSGKKDVFGLSQMLEENPFDIPEQMISDWLDVRKSKRAKMTPTAWKGTNSVLTKLKDAGLNPVECFEGMVASGWQGIKVSYFEKEISALKPKQPLKYVPKEDRAAEYEKIAARESESERRKKEEIEASKNLKSIVSEAKEKIRFADRLKASLEDLEKIKDELP